MQQKSQILFDRLNDDDKSKYILIQSHLVKQIVSYRSENYVLINSMPRSEVKNNYNFSVEFLMVFRFTFCFLTRREAFCVSETALSFYLLRLFICCSSSRASKMLQPWLEVLIVISSSPSESNIRK